MGDAACWLERTCLSCGRFLEPPDADAARCPHCGAERVTDPPVAGDVPETPRTERERPR